jgi:hypothetical protein
MKNQPAPITRWYIPDIAAYLGHTERHTRNTTVKRLGFPPPIVNTSQRTRWWDAAEVMRWAQQDRRAA